MRWAYFFRWNFLVNCWCYSKKKMGQLFDLKVPHRSISHLDVSLCVYLEEKPRFVLIPTFDRLWHRFIRGHCSSVVLDFSQFPFTAFLEIENEMQCNEFECWHRRQINDNVTKASFHCRTDKWWNLISIVVDRWTEASNRHHIWYSLFCFSWSWLWRWMWTSPPCTEC